MRTVTRVRAFVRFAALGLWLLASGGLLGGMPALAAEQELTEAERQELVELPRQFRGAREDSARQEEIIRRAVELGPLAVRKVRPIVEADYRRAFMEYSRVFVPQVRRTEEPTLDKVLEDHPRLGELRTRALALARLAALLPPQDEGNPTPNLEQQLIKAEELTIDQARLAVALNRLDAQEAAVIVETNKQRVAKGLPLLQVDFNLCRAAADHSHDMVTHKFFSHTSPVPGKATFGDRAARFGASAAAENIAQGDDGRSAVTMWMKSDGHRANILNPGFRRIGVGRARGHFTQVFGR